MVEKNKILAISLLVLFVILMIVFDPFWVAFFMLVSVLVFAIVLAVISLGWKKFFKVLGSVLVELYKEFIFFIKNLFSRKKNKAVVEEKKVKSKGKSKSDVDKKIRRKNAVKK